MIPITVFTPAYNRADLLPQGYAALKRQTNKNFIWMIIDDGSTDNTRELVEKWINDEKDFQIEYYYKENGGLYTAYNEAISHLKTELNICIDSDDYLPDDGIEKILNFWAENGSDEYAGIIGLDFIPGAGPIGDELLPNVKSINLMDDATGKHKMKKVDRKLVVRSDLYKKVAPMIGFPGEKNFNPSYLNIAISKKYDFLVLNENLCFVDYQPQGMSSNIWKQYYNSPQSFAKMRVQNLSFEGLTLEYTFRQYVHYISSCFIAKKDCGLKNKNWVLYSLAVPFGVALSLFVKLKNK